MITVVTALPWESKVRGMSSLCWDEEASRFRNRESTCMDDTACTLIRAITSGMVGTMMEVHLDDLRRRRSVHSVRCRH